MEWKSKIEDECPRGETQAGTAPCVPSVVFSFPLFSGFPLTACKNRIIMLKCIIMAWYVSERKTVTIFLCKLLKIGGVPKPFCVIFCKA